MRLVDYDPAVAANQPAAPGWPHDDTADALRLAEHGGRVWLVVDNDGRIVGECGTKAPPDTDGTVEIGYGLAAPSRGRGLGAQAVAALVDRLKAQDGVRRVEAEVHVGNVASQRVLERAGFTATSVDGALARFALDLGPVE